MLLLKFVGRIRAVVFIPTPTSHQLLLPNSSFRLISSTSNANFTLDYLINSCGLSPESALKASKSVQLKSPTRPDSVLSLFKSFDIPQPHISKLIINLPTLLLANPNKTLKPKLETFRNLGATGSTLGKLLLTERCYLVTSLNNRILPAISFFKSIVHTDSNVVKILSRSARMVGNVECKMGPNISLLRDHGLPESSISKFIIESPQSLLMKPDRFKEVLLQLKKLGVSHSDSMFLRCLQVLLGKTKPKWDAKVAVYKSFGWSEDDVLSMFMKQPFVMSMSEKKINLGMNFLMENLNWTQGDVARYPTVLMLSLEKRVIPRSCVLQTLLSKDLINKASIGRALISTENVFVKKFVIKYHHQVPDILKLYQSKMSTYGSEMSE